MIHLFIALPLVLKALAATAVITFVATITLDLVIKWFQSRSKLKKSDKNNIAFTLKDEMDKGNYVVYQGIFNKETNEVLDSQRLESKNMDTQLEQLHQDKQLVIYE